MRSLGACGRRPGVRPDTEPVRPFDDLDQMTVDCGPHWGSPPSSSSTRADRFGERQRRFAAAVIRRSPRARQEFWARPLFDPDDRRHLRHAGRRVGTRSHSQNAPRTAAEYRIPRCPPPAFQPAARAHLCPSDPRHRGRRRGRQPRPQPPEPPHAPTRTSLPCLRNPIEQRPKRIRRCATIEPPPASGATAMQKSRWRPATGGIPGDGGTGEMARSTRCFPPERTFRR